MENEKLLEVLEKIENNQNRQIEISSKLLDIQQAQFNKAVEISEKSVQIQGVSVKIQKIAIGVVIFIVAALLFRIFK